MKAATKSMSSLAEKLSPDGSLFEKGERADVAARQILLSSLVCLEHNEPGVLDQGNEEFLHDYRIALRRSRAALGQIKDVFPESVGTRFRNRLTQLGNVSTPARDYDVYLQNFDNLKSLLPAAHRDALEPLRHLLEQQRTLAYGTLIRHLTSARHRQFITAWRDFLESGPPTKPQATNASTPIVELAKRRIWKLYRRALKDGLAIKHGSPAGQIHGLRKTCKKLRYLLEFFRHFYPIDTMTHAIKVLKRIQDYLGAFQDICVQIDALRALGHLARKQTDIPTETLLAMGLLLGQLERKQQALREEFPKRFKSFASDSHQTEYRRLFHNQPDSQARHGHSSVDILV